MAKTIDLEVDGDNGPVSVSFRMPKRLEMEAFLAQFSDKLVISQGADLLKLLCTTHSAAELDKLLDDNYTMISVVMAEIRVRQEQGIRLVKKG